MNSSNSSLAPHRGKIRRRATIAVTGLAATALVAVPIVMSGQAQAAPSDLSEGQAQVLQSQLFTSPLVNLGYATTGNPSSPSQKNNALELSVLSSESIDLGGVQVPLLGPNGLLDLQGLGALSSFSESLTTDTSRAASGTIGQDGTPAVSPNSGVGANPGYLDLTQLMKQLTGTGLTDQILNQARIEIGAFASEAAQEQTNATSRYSIAGLNLKLGSPLLASLPESLNNALNQAVTPIGDLVSSTGPLTQLLNTIKTTIGNGSIAGVSSLRVDSATVTLSGLDTAVQNATQSILGAPISNSSGSVIVDLSTGQVTVDLTKLLQESGGGDLSSLPPNTNLLSDTLIEAVLSGITESVQSLNTKIADALTAVLNSLTVTMDLGVSAGCVSVLGVETCVAKGKVTVTGSLADFSGVSGKSPVISTTLAAAGIDFGTGINNLVKPVLDSAISSTTGPLIKTAVAAVTDQLPAVVESVTGPALSTLLPILEQVLARTVDVTINEQPTAAPLYGVGDLGADSSTVRAISLTLLPNNSRATPAKLSLASSTVRVTAPTTGGNADSGANADAGAGANTGANANADSGASANTGANANADTGSSANTGANANAASNANTGASANNASNANAAANVDTASNISGSSQGALAVTGSNGVMPLLFGSAVVLLLGAALVGSALARRRKISDSTAAES